MHLNNPNTSHTPCPSRDTITPCCSQNGCTLKRNHHVVPATQSLLISVACPHSLGAVLENPWVRLDIFQRKPLLRIKYE